MNLYSTQRTIIQLHLHVLRTISSKRERIFQKVSFSLENAEMPTDIGRNTISIIYHCINVCSYVIFDIMLKNNYLITYEFPRVYICLYYPGY
jgi:hypothetical protein